MPCPERCGRVVRRVVDRLLALTLREWIGVLICLLVVIATGLQWYLTYCDYFEHYQNLLKEMHKLHSDCEVISKKHATAYVKMEDDCGKAKGFINTSASRLAFRDLVYSKMPHTDNLWHWISTSLGEIFSSIPGMGILVAIFMFSYPMLRRRVYERFTDEYNHRREEKARKELAKLASASVLSILAATSAKKAQPDVGEGALHDKGVSV